MDKEKKKHVLIVEDEIDLRKALLKKLSSLHIEAFGARNGREAIEVLNKERIDLIIMDMLMPEMGGLNLLNELNGRGSQKQIPIIILTNDDRKMTEMSAALKGCSAYFLKVNTSLEEIVKRVYARLGIE